jgi:DNA-directed RNA polymerase specialized sigma subunit
LFFYDGKSIDQIAEKEGTSSQTVSESIANAIKRIRKRFREAGYNVADI